MPKLKKISPLDRQIDILEQFRKKLDLEIAELYALKPREKKKKQSPQFEVVTNSSGKKFNFRIG